MRETINSNPIFQVVALGVLGILVAFLLMTKVLGGGSSGAEVESAGTAAPPAPAAAGAAPVPGADAAPAPAATVPDPAAGAPAAPAPSAVPKADRVFAAGPGLPRPVASAYGSGDTVVLFVTESGGIDDRSMKPRVQALQARSDVSVFFSDVAGIADYSRIARGISLNRAPAMIVIEPKSRAGTGIPEATVAYGYRGPESVAQAIRDINYNGKQLGFGPD